MKFSNTILFVLIYVLTSSLKAVELILQQAQQEPQIVVVKERKQKIQLKNNDQIFILENKKISNSNYAKIVKNQKKNFLTFFTEDTDPYTKKITNYKDCLIKESEYEIYFYSGPESAWFQCFANQKKQKAQRAWVYCQGQLIDLIVFSNQAEILEVKCKSETLLNSEIK
jgi:hypothetical protein